ncbi:GSCFA family protein [Pustulibacterium marinum]|uniref:GSCFA family protein n=1 Tax=Pustulibacterium marinum TaxID=1224947 RepID=A0A1I7F377_9FLAO|nr:GSCFA domain-containing protein [Pustulibacterium marinum]SFU30604.1 GSCFA family protein [Pustulibacterium marinum]
MKLQTQIPFQKQPQPIGYEDRLLLMGSCFASNMAEKLAYYKFQHVVNPFGVLFHPIAIEKLLTRAINKEAFTDADIFFANEQWHCFDVHSELSHADKDIFLENLNKQLTNLHASVHNATYFVLTLGTAWVYRLIEKDDLVANCHKIPQKKFLKEILSVEEVVASLENISVLLKSINPQLKMITTVSPVRHLKDGFVENMQSKAHLLAAVQQVVTPREQLYYFPSYELMMDELRDYRFYKEDMIHPNALAVTYIWKKFLDVWFSEEAIQFSKEIDQIQKGLSHRSFNAQSEAHQQFLEKLNMKITKLKERYSFLKF